MIASSVRARAWALPRPLSLRSVQRRAAVRGAGFSEGEIAEILAHVALNVFTNYFNVAADVEIDFPKVSYAEIA